MAQRVIIYRLGSLGDTVVALPCFHKIAESFPDHERIVLTNFPVSSKAAPLEAILGGSGLIHGTLAYPVRTRSPWALWRLMKSIRALEVRDLVYLAPARGIKAVARDVLFFRLCGISRIIGAPITADLQRNLFDAGTGLMEREGQRLARCLSGLGQVDLSDAEKWNLHLTAAEQKAGVSALSPLGGKSFVAVNMGGKVKINDWGEARWQALMTRLAGAMPGFGLAFIGAAEDAERATRVSAIWPGPVLNSCGNLPPRVSAALLAKAVLFIGHDSGPLHLASAVGCSTIGLFSDNNPPGKWYPLNGKSIVLQSDGPIETIGVDEVYDAVLHALDGKLMSASNADISDS